MAISQNLKRLYASAPSNRRIFQALILSNPSWTEEILLVDNSIAPMTFNWGGVNKTFQPSVFEVELPRLDLQSTPELTVSFPNFGKQLIDLLELAAKSNAPILVQLTSFTDYDNQPGIWPPLILEITEVALDALWCTGTARRDDFINRAFPREVFTIQKYPGLYR
jgi:hypothetical protein